MVERKKFTESAIEQAYLESDRDERKRYHIWFCLLGGSLFFSVALVDWLRISELSDFYNLIALRAVAWLACLLAALNLSRSTTNRHMETTMMLVMAIVGIAATCVPLWYPEEARLHILITVLLAVIYYTLIPLRVWRMVAVMAVMFSSLLFVMIKGLNSPLFDVLGMSILFVFGNLFGYINQRRNDSHLRKIYRQKLELQHQQEILDEAFHSMAEGIVVYDQERKVVACNDRFRTFYGYNSELAKAGTSFEQLSEIDRKWKTLVQGREGFLGRYQGVNVGEQEFIVQLRSGRWLQVRDRQTPSGHIVSLQTDISKLKQAEEKINHLANYDALTGVPTLRLAMDRLEKSEAYAKRHQTKFALLFIDLDGFKGVNDAFGHQVGDQVLRVTAQRMQQVLRQSDTIARIGGDEFWVILPELKKAEDAAGVAQLLVETVARKVKLDEADVEIGASIGIAIWPNDTSKAQQLIQCADEAMYQAKEQGKNGFRFYSNFADPEPLSDASAVASLVSSHKTSS